MPKLIIFIFTGVIVLVGASVILMQQMEIGFFASEEVLEDKPKEPEVLRVVTMEPLLIPIFEENKVSLNLQLELQIKTPENKELYLQRKLPVLKDAYIRDLFSFIPRQLRKNKKLDLSTLNRRLKVVGQRTIGKGVINLVEVKSYSEAKENTDGKAEEPPEEPAATVAK